MELGNNRKRRTKSIQQEQIKNILEILETLKQIKEFFVNGNLQALKENIDNIIADIREIRKEIDSLKEEIITIRSSFKEMDRRIDEAPQKASWMFWGTLVVLIATILANFIFNFLLKK